MTKYVPKLLALAFAVSLPALVHAEPSDNTKRNAARRLGEEGIALEDKGDHAAALERFEHALELMPVPTLALLAGQTLEKLGRLVEAEERYRSAVGMHIDATMPEAFQQGQRDAQADATRAAEALHGRIPSLRVVLTGASASDVEVTLDGKPLAKELVGLDVPVDPGPHELSAKRGTDLRTRSVSVSEKQKLDVSFELPAPPAVPPSPGPAPFVPMARPPEAEKPAPASIWPTVGWVGVGVGAVGVGIGAAYYFRARGKANDLESACGGDACSSNHQTAVDDYNREKTISTIGFAVGGVAALAGGAILVMSSTSPSSRRVGVRPFVGAGSAGIAGAF